MGACTTIPTEIKTLNICTQKSNHPERIDETQMINDLKRDFTFAQFQELQIRTTINISSIKQEKLLISGYCRKWIKTNSDSAIYTSTLLLISSYCTLSLDSVILSYSETSHLLHLINQKIN